MTRIPISAARSQLGALVRRAAHGRETIALTDHGHVAALLVSPQVIEDLEDAVADYQRRKAEGTREPCDHGSRNSSRLPTGSSE
ncbi:type II toxin-antitoxin system Phd/YefM family antitoxin [Streptomyces luteolifulvus]|uniref:Antitoxin n=1 Tax=Streptomyces luteolifulvus TaxID=2615112 RepID=A0A6H9UW99_9ACTN|nr:type II toxin-antitoxin system Phd/YefM family antitoxin [Streptomyces luteolifulvus]KAB1143965.1 type II toxin-antitoxin system Phd/YefM family antitoxin [Streptomyces luteolifulvus]